MPMLHPSLDGLLKKVDSKYTLVVAASRRARNIIDGSPPTVETVSTKPVTIALEEVSQGKLTYERTKTGIK